MSIDERTYIDISDLTHIRIINYLLHLIVPANSPGIDEEEYKAVCAILHKWQEYLAIKIVSK